MITIEKLREYGANVDEGLARCLNKEDFYIKMVNLGLSDERFEKLDDIFASKDLDAAFEAVQALKGVIANLALTPLSSPIEKMTELLRSRTNTDYGELVAQVKEERNKILAM